MSESNFKVGDRVSWLGLKGTVATVTKCIVQIDTDDGSLFSFDLEGRFCPRQRPSLKKLKKKKARYFRVGVTGHFFDENCMAHHPDNFKDHWFKHMGTKRPKGAL